MTRNAECRQDYNSGRASCDVIVINGVLMTVDPLNTVVEDGALAIESGRIVAVGSTRDILAQYQGKKIIDAGGGVVHPGFIDAHAHVNQYTSRSVLPRMQSTDITMGHWKAQLRPEDEHASTALAAIDYVTNGYTAFIDPGTIFEPDAAATAAQEIGIRAWLTDPYVGDLPETLREFLPDLVSDSFLSLWPKDLDAAMARMGSQLFRNREADGLVRGFIGLYGEGTDSLELFRHGFELAREHGVQLQEHLGYLPKLHRAREAKVGKSFVHYLDNENVLDHHVTFIHMNVVHEEDVGVMAERDVRIVWCPYGQISMNADDHVEGRMTELFRAGVSVGIGSDIARVSDFDALGSLAMMAAIITGNPATADEILRMRTIGAAASIGAEAELGSLEPGKRADLVIRKGDAAENLGLHRPLEVGLLGGRGSIDTVLVNGVPVVEDGNVSRVEAGSVVEKARSSVQKITQRIGLS